MYGVSIVITRSSSSVLDRRSTVVVNDGRTEIWLLAGKRAVKTMTILQQLPPMHLLAGFSDALVYDNRRCSLGSTGSDLRSQTPLIRSRCVLIGCRA